MTEYSALMELDRLFVVGGVNHQEPLDHTRRLLAVAAQPACIHFADGTRHYPDFLALHDSGVRVMYDLRPASLVDDEATAETAPHAEACGAVLL